MALEKFEDWTAPWEKSGDEFDAEKAKKYVYDVLRDREDAREQVAAATKERDALHAKVAQVDPKNAAEVESLRKEIETTKAKNEEALKAERLKAARLEVAMEHKLTAKQASRLRGDTPEEIAADAKELVQDLFGEQGPAGDDKDAPRGRFRTGADDGKESEDTDPESLAKFF